MATKGKKKGKENEYPIVTGPSLMDLMLSVFDGKRVIFTVGVDENQDGKKIPIAFDDGVVLSATAVTRERISWKIGGRVFYDSTFRRVLPTTCDFTADYNSKTRQGKMWLGKDLVKHV